MNGICRISVGYDGEKSNSRRFGEWDKSAQIELVQVWG